MLPNNNITHITNPYHLPIYSHIRPVNEFEVHLLRALDISPEDNPMNTENAILDDGLPNIISIMVNNTYYTLEQRDIPVTYANNALLLKNIISQYSDSAVGDVGLYRWSLAAFADGDGNVEYRIFAIPIVDKTLINCAESDLLSRIISGLVDDLPNHYDSTRTTVVLSGELVITPPNVEGVVGVLINCLSNVSDIWMDVSQTASPTAEVYTLILNMFAELGPPRVLVQYEIVKIPNSYSFIRTHFKTCPLDQTTTQTETDAYLTSKYGAYYSIYKFANTEDYPYYYRSTQHSRQTYLSMSRLNTHRRQSHTPSVYYANMFNHLSPLTEEERLRFSIN
jgi:hypothetical protein